MPMSTTAGMDLTATLMDEDSGVANQAWSWETSSDGSAWNAATGTVTSDGNTSTYTTVDADAGMYVRASVTYDDDHDTGHMAESGNAMVMPSPTRSWPSTTPMTPTAMIDRNEAIAALMAYLDPNDPILSTVNEAIAVLQRYLDGQ